MYLVLVSFTFGFEKFEVDNLVKYRREIFCKLPVKIGGDVFVWTLCINTKMLNILRLYKSSTLSDLKVLLDIQILSYYGLLE